MKQSSYDAPRPSADVADGDEDMRLALRDGMPMLLYHHHLLTYLPTYLMRYIYIYMLKQSHDQEKACMELNREDSTVRRWVFMLGIDTRQGIYISGVEIGAGGWWLV